MTFKNNILTALLLSQVGEFAFVLLNFSTTLHIVDKTTFDLLMAVTAISMVITPMLLVVYEIVQKFTLKNVEVPKQKPDEIHSKHDVILIGFGHFGSTIGRFLRANGISATILDSDPDRVTMLRKMGFNVYFGDGTDVDLLFAAGAEKAKYLIATVDPPSVNQQIITLVKKHFPHLEIIARAKNRYDAYELLDMGIESIYRETLYTAVHLAVDVLAKLGMRAYTAERKGQDFITFDEAAMKKLAKDRHDTKQYILSVREQIELQEKLLSEDLHFTLTQHDNAWDSEPLIKNAQPKQR
jgi:CPA2 family monovalent cation:H+ antiporter-2